MRLACPACQATYDIPDNLLGAGGRRLRCARCAAEWQAYPPAPSDEAVIAPLAPPPAAASHDPESEPAADKPGDAPGDALAEAASVEAERPARTPVRNAFEVRGEPRTTHAARLERLSEETRQAQTSRRNGAAVVAVLWLLSLAVLGAGGAACYVWRAQVMAAWPPSQRIYLALGVR